MCLHWVVFKLNIMDLKKIEEEINQVLGSETNESLMEFCSKAMDTRVVTIEKDDSEYYMYEFKEDMVCYYKITGTTLYTITIMNETKFFTLNIAQYTEILKNDDLKPISKQQYLEIITDITNQFI